MNRFYRKCRILLAIIPIFVLIVFYSFVFWVTIKIGHIPHYNFPDPKTEGISVIYDIVNSIINIFVVIIMISIFTTIVLITKRKIIWGWKEFVFIVGLLLMILLIAFDPGRLFEWFVD